MFHMRMDQLALPWVVPARMPLTRIGRAARTLSTWRYLLRRGITVAVLTSLVTACEALSPVAEEVPVEVSPIAAAVSASANPNPVASTSSAQTALIPVPGTVPASATATPRVALPRGLNEGLLPPEGEEPRFGGLRADMGLFVQRGHASWYGPGFHGRKTASGERFDMNAMTAAHPTLPLGSWILVRNLRNDRTVMLRVTDRGPFAKKRVLDVSRAAANRLGFIRQGATRVEIRKLSSVEVAAIQKNEVDASSETASPAGSTGMLADGNAGP